MPTMPLVDDMKEHVCGIGADALVVTVANDSPDLYNKIAQRYRTMLEPLRLVIQIPIRSSQSSR